MSHLTFIHLSWNIVNLGNVQTQHKYSFLLLNQGLKPMALNISYFLFRNILGRFCFNLWNRQKLIYFWRRVCLNLQGKKPTQNWIQIFLWCLFRLFKLLSISLCISNVYFNSWEEEKRNRLTLQFIKLGLSRVCSISKQQQMEQSIITPGDLWKCERISHYITQKISSECSKGNCLKFHLFPKIAIHSKRKGIE